MFFLSEINWHVTYIQVDIYIPLYKNYLVQRFILKDTPEVKEPENLTYFI